MKAVEAREMSRRGKATVACMGSPNLVLAIEQVEGTLGSSWKIFRDWIRNRGRGSILCCLWLSGRFSRQGGTRLTWGISVMALGQKLGTGQQERNRGPAIAVDFEL
jgi:hypothetical protein